MIPRREREKAPKKTLKETKKVLKKGLTNERLCGIVEKLSTEGSEIGP